MRGGEGGVWRLGIDALSVGQHCVYRSKRIDEMHDSRGTEFNSWDSLKRMDQQTVITTVI